MDDKQIEATLKMMERGDPADGQLAAVLRNLLGRIRDLEQGGETEAELEHEPPHDMNDLD